MSKETEKLLFSAQKLVQKGQIDKAIKEYLKILEIDKKDVKTHLRLGDLYAKSKNKESAVKHYLEAAKYYTKDGFYSKAVSVYKQILNLDDTREDVYVNLADLYQRLGMVGEALGQYQRISANYEKEGKLKEAMDIYRKMAELDPKNVLVLTKLAELYYKNGMKKEGYQAFKRALEELKEQNRFEEYVRLMEKLAKADPENAENLKELVGIYIKRKMYDRAYPMLVKVREREPDNLEALTNLAQVCIKLDRKDEAVNFFKELAKGYQKKGLRQKAKEVLEKVLELDPNDESVRRALGASAPKEEEVVELEEEVGGIAKPEAEEEVEELEEAVEESVVISAPKKEEVPTEILSPEQIKEHLTEADVYFKYGLRDKALTHIQAVLKSDPKNIEAFKRLKIVELDSKNQSAALETLKTIATLAEQKADWQSLQETGLEYLKLVPNDPLAQRWLKKAEEELTKQVVAKAPEVAEQAEVMEEEPEVIEEAPAVAPSPPAKPAEAKKAQPTKEQVVVISGRAKPALDFKEEIEEAEFYVQQGLIEYALKSYLDILQKDPSHKQALKRVKELEEAIKQKAPKEEAPEVIEEETPVVVEEEVEEEVVISEPAEVSGKQEEPRASVETQPAQIETSQEPIVSEPPEEVIEEQVEVEEEEEKLDIGLEPGQAEKVAGFAPESEIPAQVISAGGLEEPKSAERADEASQEPGLGGAEEGLFDLAAELEKEDLGPAPDVQGLSTSEKYSFEDMFKAFKEGVSKVVSEEDAGTHYDLGIAYKEMGLYEDAVREFQGALKAGHNPSDCYLMAGLCAMERGRYEQAIEEYERGLSAGKISEKEKSAFFYELGQAWVGLGDFNRALKMFEKSQALDPGFRDVESRVKELKARLSGVKPEVPPAPSREEVRWESAALKSEEQEKAEEAEGEEEKKKKGKKITYV